MTGVTKEELIQFNRAVLKRVFNARLVDGAIADVVEQMNWPQLEELGNGPPVMRSTEKLAGGDGGKGGKKRKKAGEEGEGGKESGGKAKPPHTLSAYTLFITLAMDMIAQDPDNPAFKVPEKLDESGQPIKKGGGKGGKMTAASGLWSSLSEQQKAAFQQFFKPLTDSFNKETHETGSKVKDVSSRVKEFRQTLPEKDQQELRRIFQHAMASNPRSSNHAPSSPSPSNHHQQQKSPAAKEVPEDASSDDSEEEDEEEPSQQQQLKEQEERQLQQEAKEKKKEGKEGKDGKKEKKREGKVKEGKKGEEVSTKKKKKKIVVSDDST